MVVLCLVLAPSVNRWTNVVLGIAYTAIIVLTIPGTWTYYVFLGIVECALTLTIAWSAWRWPRRRTSDDPLTDRRRAPRGAM
jgi:ABC-type transport system involved in Fe-S cluster assembly fused permease/ATPase subunit